MFFFSKTHPGYEIFYIIGVLFAAYVTLVFVYSDLCFLYSTLYISFNLDILKYLVVQLGDKSNKSNYRTTERQTKLLKKIIVRHISVSRYNFALCCFIPHYLIILLTAILDFVPIYFRL